MASLTSMTLNNQALTTTGPVQNTGMDITEWTQLYHCANASSTTVCNPVYACGYLHVRTPIPATVTHTAMWQIMGYHSYSSEMWQDNKTIVRCNTSGVVGYQTYESNNAANSGFTAASPYFYTSSSNYAGYSGGSTKRICFSINKYGCCCNGWLKIRLMGGNMSQYWSIDGLGWGTIGGATQTGVYF